MATLIGRSTCLSLGTHPGMHLPPRGPKGGPQGPQGGPFRGLCGDKRARGRAWMWHTAGCWVLCTSRRWCSMPLVLRSAAVLHNAERAGSSRRRYRLVVSGYVPTGPQNVVDTPSGRLLVLFCFVLFYLQLSVCLWWHDYRRDDFPTLKFGVVIADLLAIC